MANVLVFQIQKMQLTCKNCNTVYTGKFCNMCGQTADTNPINLHFLLKELKATYIKYDDGFFYTLKQLFTRPGKFIREYLEGKRINRTKPISFVIIAAGIYSFLYLYLDIQPAPIADADKSEIDSEKLNHWIINNFAIAELLLMPLFAIASTISFYKSKYNFFEHVILNCYVFGQRIFLNLLSFPFLIIYNKTPELANVTNVTLAANVIILFWTFSNFFSGQSKFITFVLSVLTYIIVVIELAIIISIYTVFN